MHIVVQDLTRIVYVVTLSAGEWHVSDRGSDTEPAMAAAILALIADRLESRARRIPPIDPAYDAREHSEDLLSKPGQRG